MLFQYRDRQVARCRDSASLPQWQMRMTLTGISALGGSP